jgi:hypothetical protein
MDQTKRTNALVSEQLAKVAGGTEGQAAEIRILEDQELVLCGGGDGVPCW